MDAAENAGPRMMVILWSLTAVVFVFLILRLYTRIYCVSSYGIDDHLYVLSFFILIAYCSLMQKAVEHGYGRDVDTLDPNDRVAADLYRTAGQTHAMIVTAVAKATVGFFLLRLVSVKWHRIVVWCAMSVFTTISVLTALITWLGCKPIAYVWDYRVDGSCVNSQPITIMFGLGTILLDIGFAVLAWIFIWRLQMTRREKIIIAGSLSLGIFAAAAGIMRVVVIRGTRIVAVEVVIWSTTEICVTLICIGIPACIPLYMLWYHSLTGSKKNTTGKDSSEPPIGMLTFGGSPMPGGPSETSQGFRLKPKKLNTLFSQISLATRDERTRGDGDSDQGILHDNSGRGVMREWESDRENNDTKQLQGQQSMGLPLSSS